MVEDLILDEIKSLYRPLKLSKLKYKACELTIYNYTNVDLGSACVAVMGAFDGFHKGHKMLVQSAHKFAVKKKLPLLAVMFSPDPDAYFHPDKTAFQLMDTQMRVHALLRAGVDQVVVYDFNEHLAKLPYESFARDQIQAFLKVQDLFVGENFRFGYKAQGTVESLLQLKLFNVHDEALVNLEGSTVSSTRIRACMQEGNVEEAITLLGHLPSYKGLVVHGRGEGTGFGYPTANIECPMDVCISQKDVFACLVSDGHKIWPSAIHMGRPPMFETIKTQITTYYAEAHLIDCAEDLYGKELSVFFLKKIGITQKFNSLDLLKEALKSYQKWVEENVSATFWEV